MPLFAKQGVEHEFANPSRPQAQDAPYANNPADKDVYRIKDSQDATNDAERGEHEGPSE